MKKNTLLKKVTSTLVLSWLLISTFATSASAMEWNKFKDVNYTDPWYEAINAVANAWYFSGYKDWTFKPNSSISKIEALAVITRAANNSEIIDEYKKLNSGTSEYDDIPVNEWYTWLINFAKENGIINKNITIDWDTFWKSDTINRAQFIEIFTNAFGIEKDTVEASLKEITFYDIKYNHDFHWAAPAANVMQNNLRYVNWYSKYSFGPDNDISRREVAWVLNKFITYPDKLADVEIKNSVKELLKPSVLAIINKWKEIIVVDENEEDNNDEFLDVLFNWGLDWNLDEEINTDSTDDNTVEETNTDSTDDNTVEETNTDSTDEDIIIENTIKISDNYDTSNITIPNWIAWLKVLEFEISARKEDITIEGFEVKRTWFSTKDTIESLSIADNEWNRISKLRDDRNWKDDIAKISLFDEITIKKWETKTFIVNAEIKRDWNLSWDEFQIELIKIEQSWDELDISKIKSRTFKVSSSDSWEVLVENNWEVSNPKIGDKKEILKFKLVWDNDDDAMFRAITIKADNNEIEENFKDYKLIYDKENTVIATAEKSNWKYITFKLTKDFALLEWKIEKFTVKATIIDGSNDIIKFYIDEPSDVVIKNSRLNFSTWINISTVDSSWDLGIITIEAWELSIKAIDADNENIKEDKKNIELGSIKITNVQWKNLELKKLSVKLAVTWDAYIDVNNNNVMDAWEKVTIDTLLENIELVNSSTGKRHDLTKIWNSDIYGDNDLNIELESWETTLRVEADVLKNIKDFDKIRVNMSLKTWDDNYSTHGAFYVEETIDDSEVDDITPSGITFKTIRWVEAEATLSFTPLANITVVRGAQEVKLIDFEVKADKSSTLTVNNIIVKLHSNGLDASRNEITEIKLYKKVWDDFTLLDTVSGTDIVNGKILISDFRDRIEPSEKSSYVIEATIIDSDAIVWKIIKWKIESIEIEDEETNDVKIIWLTTQGTRDVTITSAWTLTLSYNANDNVNKDEKTVLAWEKIKFVEYKLNATNEKIDIWKLVLTLTGSSWIDLKKTIEYWNLYLDGQLLESNSNSDIDSTNSTITFDNLENLIIPKEESTLTFELVTSRIGYEKIGQTLIDVKSTQLVLTDAEGKDSNKVVPDATLTQDSNLFTIAPATIEAIVSQQFWTEAKLKIKINSWDNTEMNSTTDIKVDIETLIFTELGNSLETDWYILYKEWDSWTSITWVNAWGTVSFDLSSFANKRISNEETFLIRTRGTVDKTYGLKLRKNWIIYKTTSDESLTPLTGNLTDEKDFWSKTY